MSVTEATPRSPDGDLYERDFYAWALNQADELRRWAETRPNAAIDFEHLIEEVEALAGNGLDAVLSRLERIIVHLLKLEYSPSAYPRRQWRISVISARRQLRRRLTGTMRPKVEAELDGLFGYARTTARLELLDDRERQAADALPVSLPYTLDQLTDPDWLPPNRHGLIDEP